MRITFWAVIALAAVLHAELANEDKAYGALHGRISGRIRLWPDMAPRIQMALTAANAAFPSCAGRGGLI